MGRHYSYQIVSYLYTLLGFVASPIENTAERYLMRNDELINKIKSDAERYREVAKVGAQINLSASQYSRRDHEFIYSKVSPQ
jgi:proline dehydrogenase